MLNKIMLMGRLTRDPEMRQTKNALSVSHFTLAVDRNYARDGAKETDFFDVIAWRSTAEFVNKYFVKGQLVCVEGRLQRRSWTDENGNKRYAYEVISDSVYFAENHNHPHSGWFEESAPIRGLNHQTSLSLRSGRSSIRFI